MIFEDVGCISFRNILKLFNSVKSPAASFRYNYIISMTKGAL